MHAHQPDRIHGRAGGRRRAAPDDSPAALVPRPPPSSPSQQAVQTTQAALDALPGAIASIAVGLEAPHRAVQMTMMIRALENDLYKGGVVAGTSRPRYARQGPRYARQLAPRSHSSPSMAAEAVSRRLGDMVASQPLDALLRELAWLRAGSGWERPRRAVHDVAGWLRGTPRTLAACPPHTPTPRIGCPGCSIRRPSWPA